MKKKNKKNHVRSRLSTILLCILAIVLCAAPVLHAATVTVPANETCDIDGLVDGVLRVDFNGTANLLTGASVTQAIYVQIGGTLNMYSGTVGWFISVSPDASMTVYGTEFEVDGYPCDYGEITLTGGMGTLKGTYGDGSSINLWVWSDTPINLQPPSRIKIDIKPGGNPNNINPRSKGVVPVAVLSTWDAVLLTWDFDASTIDPGSVEFEGVEPERWKLCDVDGDGHLDMLFHFDTQELFKNDLNEDSTEATLTGKTFYTFGGDTIIGTDRVWIVPRKK